MQGKNALITGASRGIGRACAIALAKAGCNIAFTYNSDEKAAQEACEAARAFGVRAESFKCDAADFAASGEVCANVISSFGGVDILVNNAGITRDGLILKMTEEDFDRVLDVNLKGAFNMIKHTYQQFMRRRSGRIINVASVAGLAGNAGQANYAAAKAGLVGLTKSVAKELASRAVTCNAVAPGFIETDMTGVMQQKSRDALLSGIPVQRAGTSEEVASLVLFLASDAAAYITGEVIKIDGGLFM